MAGWTFIAGQFEYGQPVDQGKAKAITGFVLASGRNLMRELVQILGNVLSRHSLAF